MPSRGASPGHCQLVGGFPTAGSQAAVAFLGIFLLAAYAVALADGKVRKQPEVTTFIPRKYFASSLALWTIGIFFRLLSLTFTECRVGAPISQLALSVAASWLIDLAILITLAIVLLPLRSNLCKEKDPTPWARTASLRGVLFILLVLVIADNAFDTTFQMQSDEFKIRCAAALSGLKAAIDMVFLATVCFAGVDMAMGWRKTRGAVQRALPKAVVVLFVALALDKAISLGLSIGFRSPNSLKSMVPTSGVPLALSILRGCAEVVIFGSLVETSDYDRVALNIFSWLLSY